jgi:hypothetical protein
MKAFNKWTVLSHGPIEKLADNLWRVEGTLPKMPLRRVMTIARMDDGRLVIHNGIALEEEAMREIEAWGTPAFLIVPNGWHRLDAVQYKARYPAIKVIAPKGARARVEHVVHVDGTFEDFPSNGSVRLETLHGVKDVEGVMMVRSPDGVSVVLADIVFNMDKRHDPMGLLYSTLLGSAHGPRVSRVVKLFMVQDAKALRADLERLAHTPDLARLVVAHEKVARGDEAVQALWSAASHL